MFTKDIGIDLGTANTLVYMKGRGIIMREPSVVAVDPRSDELRVRSVGHEAKAVIGRAPGSIVAVRPLKDGVIADFDVTAAMLQSFIRQACGNSILARPRVVICVPSGVTEVERRAVRQAAAKAGARQVTVIEEPMAAAIGSGLPTTDAVGSMIVDIGGGTAEVAVISLSGIVASRSVRCAGDALDQSIIAFIKRKYNLLVGERTAEQIKIEIGSACPLYRMGWFKVFWQCLFTNALFCLTLVFFASAIYNTDPFAVYGSLLQGWDGLAGSWAQVSNLIYSSGIDGRLPVVLLFGCFVVFAAEHKGRSVARWIRQQVWPLRWTLYYGMAAAILFFAAFGQSAFIYQQY